MIFLFCGCSLDVYNLWRVDSLVKSKKFSEAEKYLKKSLQEDSTEDLRRLKYAIVLFENELKEEARAEIKFFLDHSKDAKSQYLGLFASAYMEYDNKNIEQALKDYQKALEYKPGDKIIRKNIELMIEDQEQSQSSKNKEKSDKDGDGKDGKKKENKEKSGDQDEPKDPQDPGKNPEDKKDSGSESTQKQEYLPKREQKALLKQIEEQEKDLQIEKSDLRKSGKSSNGKNW